jgi:hypothetical protein
MLMERPDFSSNQIIESKQTIGSNQMMAPRDDDLMTTRW